MVVSEPGKFNLGFGVAAPEKKFPGGSILRKIN
jgi:hypothetical protein